MAFVIGLVLRLTAHADAPRQSIVDPTTTARAAQTTLAPPAFIRS
jgi:hypothetical protein